MGRIVTASVMIVLTLALGIFTTLYTDSSAQTIIENIEKLRESIDGETYQTDALAEQLTDTWEKRNFVMSLYTKHSELEQLDASISRLKSLVDEDEIRQAVIECDRAIFYSEHLIKAEHATIENIF